jgi:hypothetical protein
MAISWSGKRRTIYFLILCAFALWIGVYVWVHYFNPAPTCFDGKKNGTELGVDCGGACSLVCANVAKAPLVKWARAFPNGASTYTAAAVLENQNGTAAAHSVHYLFQMYDAANILVASKAGVIDVPPVETVPIVEPSINVGNRSVVHTQFSFNATNPVVWGTIPISSIPRMHVTTQQLSQSGTRLDATLKNDSLFDAKNVTVVAILYDQDDVARAASKSTIPVISQSSSMDVTFTWPTQHTNISRTEISILPSF